MASVFQKFGGIRPMAARIRTPPSTVKSWHTEGKIPIWRHDVILAAAEEDGIPLERDALENVRPDTPVTQDAAA